MFYIDGISYHQVLKSLVLSVIILLEGLIPLPIPPLILHYV